MTEKAGVRRRRSAAQVGNMARAYRAALNRIVAGKATHPALAGRPVRITPTEVAREARHSRNPLYTTHRDILDEIATAAASPSTAGDLAVTVVQLRTENASLRTAAREHAIEKRRLASENLLLLHRARVSEEKLKSLVRREPPESRRADT
jgi:hypothetical protein